MAEACGLSKVFDVVYRYSSLEAHGNTIGLPPESDAVNGVEVALSHINAFLYAMWLVADNHNPPLSAAEVLTALNMRTILGT
jgi:hypothetical protein